MASHTDRTYAGTASAVRNRKRLVQVKVADVGTNHSRRSQAHLGVHVGAVHVDLASELVDDGGGLLYSGFKHTVGRRVGHHHSSQRLFVLLGLGAQVGKVDVSVHVAANYYNIHTGHYG